jgi:hypothetical protein
VQCSDPGYGGLAALTGPGRTPHPSRPDASLCTTGDRSESVALCVVVVLDDRKRLATLKERLAAADPAPLKLLTIGQGETDIASVERLDPTASRRRRQRSMVRWLLPFGFLAGLTFTQITDLHTFDALGPWGQPVVGGLLGMISGWMGSYAAAASVASEEDDRIRSLRNRLDEGNWLLLIEPAGDGEPPWTLIQQARPRAVIRLGDS